MIDSIEAARGRATLRVEEAAQILGVSRSSAYEAVRHGQLPSLRLGRRILIPTARFLALLEDEEIEPSAVSEKEKAPAAHTEASTNPNDSTAQGEISDHLSPAR